MLLVPPCVVVQDRRQQPVMRQLVPGGTAALLGTDQMGVLEEQQRRLHIVDTVLRSLAGLSSKSLFQDELRVEPLADRALAYAGAAGDVGDLLGVVHRERLVHIPCALNVRLADLGLLGLEPIPQPKADDLELYRLDVGTGLRLARAIRLRHQDLA